MRREHNTWTAVIITKTLKERIASFTENIKSVYALFTKKAPHAKETAAAEIDLSSSKSYTWTTTKKAAIEQTTQLVPKNLYAQ